MSENHLTFSRIKDFQICPKFYDFRYRQELPAFASPAQDGGRAFHEFERRFLEHLKEKRLFTDLEWIRNHTFREFGPFVGLRDSGYEDIVGVINRWHDENYLFEPIADWGHVDIEFKFAFDEKWKPCMWDAAEMRFRGIIDANQYDPKRRTLKLHDWKTNRSLPKHEVINRDLQLLCYAFAAMAYYPQATEAEVILQYVRYPKAEGRSRVISREEAMLWPEIAATKRKEIAESDFAPRPGTHCANGTGDDYHHCPYIFICPQFQKLHDVKTSLSLVQTEQEAMDALKEMLALEAATKARRAMLKAWVKVNGPIPAGNGEVFGEKTTEKKTRETFVVMSYLRKKGIHEDEIVSNALRVDARGFRKLAIAHRFNEDDVEAITSHSHRFCIFNPEQIDENEGEE